MLSSVFAGWYTDTMDIYRIENVQSGNLDVQERKKVNEKPVPCRIYATQLNGPNMTDTASEMRSLEKLSCDITTDIKAGDELLIFRGGNIDKVCEPERYFAGKPQSFHDPVGGALTGLQHKEVGLLYESIVG